METAQAACQSGANRRKRSRSLRNSNANAPSNRGGKVKQRLKIVHRHYHISSSNYAFRNLCLGNHFFWQETTFWKLLFTTCGATEQQISTPPIFMHLMKYGVPVVLALLPLKYQGNASSIFKENPVPLLCFIAATFLYWLTVGAMKQMTTLSRKWIQALIHVALASVLVSAISLISIFLPYPISLLPIAVLIFSPVASALVYGFILLLKYVRSQEDTLPINLG